MATTGGGIATLALAGSVNNGAPQVFPTVDPMTTLTSSQLFLARIDTQSRSVLFSTPVPAGEVPYVSGLSLDSTGATYLAVRATPAQLEPLQGSLPTSITPYVPYAAVLRVASVSTPASVTVTANFESRRFTVEGSNCEAGTYITPRSFHWPPGRTCIVTFAQEDANGARYTLKQWENSSTSAARSITATGSPLTATATLERRWELQVQMNGCCAGTVSPAGLSYHLPGTVVPITFTPGTGTSFVRWHSSQFTVSNTLSATATITMNNSGTVEAIIAATPGSNSTPLQFVPVTPCRVADTRNAPGTFGQPAVTAGVARDFPVPQSACGIPADAKAYSLNVTVVPRQTLGYLTIWPTGLTQPTVSTLNALDGRIKANAAIVPAGTNGGVSVFVNNTADVVLDINGYFIPQRSDSLMFYPLPPCRIMDTRLAQGPLGGPALQAGITRSVPIRSSACNIPASAKAYSLNTTVVPPGGAPVGYLSVWPTGQSQPVVSTLNAVTGTIVANAALVPAGNDGAGSIEVFANANTDLLVDINGYFAPPGTGGLHFYPMNPCRLYDSRVGGGPFQVPGPWDSQFGAARVMPILDFTQCGVSPLSKAFSLNLTVLPVAGLGYVTMWPDNDTPRPLVSSLNAVDGAITSNAALIPGSDLGKIVVFPSAPTNVILDINGIFAQ